MFTIWEVLLSNVLVAVVVSAGWIGYVRPLRKRLTRQGGCWRWTGAHAPNGYGQLTIRGKRVSVHRLAYEFAKGAIPEGLEIDHTCRVRDCTNPAHLEAVTHAENVRRAAKNRNQQRRAAATTTMEAA